MSASPPSLADVRQAFRTGDVIEARRQLRAILHQDPENYRAWLWLAGVTQSPAASLQYVKRARSLQASDPAVAEALSWAQKRVDIAKRESQTGLARSQPALTRAAPTIVPVRANGRGAADSADSRSRFTLDWKVIAIVMLFLTVLLLAWQVVSDLRRTPVGGTSQPVAQIETVEAAADEAVAPVPADLGGGAGQVGGVVPESAEPDPIQRIETDVRQAGLRPKVILLAADAQPLPTWTPTPSPTPAPTATPAPSPTAQASTLLQTAGFSEPRWINVDLTNQLLTAYEFDTPVYSTYITSGNWDTPTVTGQFRIYQQLQSQNMSGYHLGYDYYLPNVPYVQYFYGDFALHGAYWRDTFGTPGSHGCVNLPLPAAEWLYQFADIGTLVNVHY